MEVFGEARKLARKDHRCYWCVEWILSKTHYDRWISSDGGDIMEIKMHPECVSAMHRSDADIDGFICEGPHYRGLPCGSGCGECGTFDANLVVEKEASR